MLRVRNYFKSLKMICSRFGESASPGLLLGHSCDNTLVGSRSINWIPFFFLSNSQAKPPLLCFYENKKQSKNEQGNKECASIIKAARGAEWGKAALKGSAFGFSSWFCSLIVKSQSLGELQILAGLQHSSSLRNISSLCMCKVWTYSVPFDSDPYLRPDSPH